MFKKLFTIPKILTILVSSAGLFFLSKLVSYLNAQPKAIESEEEIQKRKRKEAIQRILNDEEESDDEDVRAPFVGLKNEGTTCYLNSLLQTLFHIPLLRKTIFQFRTTDDSITFALQKLFYNLQFNKGYSVSTYDLITAFGWDAKEAFVQHDVQELARVLISKLEEELNVHTLKNFFLGWICNEIKCLNVDYTSKSLDAFYDIQLNVRGCRDIYDSFEKYIQAEKLTGENKYNAGKYGLQDASKRCIFQKLPPVLMLHLKRFEFDPYMEQLCKITDTYEFYDEIDLDKYVSNGNGKAVSNVYTLHSVLVHAGTSAHSGHYYAFINTSPYKQKNHMKKRWCKFNDETVTEVSETKAIQKNFGGTASAYMLVYIRKSDIPHILAEVTEKQIPSELKARVESSGCTIL